MDSFKFSGHETFACRHYWLKKGYYFVSTYVKGEMGKYRLRVSPKTFARMKAKVKEITRKTTPKSFSERIDELNRFMKGWINYFKYAYMTGNLAERSHDRRE